MNRRKFLTNLTRSIAAALAVGATTVTIEGCGTIVIVDAINIVLNSALAILKVTAPGSSWLASLADAIAGLQKAETDWKAGGAATIVIEALNTIEAVIAVIPETVIYAPLVDILVAGIEAVMAAFGLTVQLSASGAKKRVTVVNSPHYHRAVLNGPSFLHPSWQGAFKAQWNQKAVALGLSQAQIN